jgi:hypothetical protein
MSFDLPPPPPRRPAPQSGGFDKGCVRAAAIAGTIVLLLAVATAVVLAIGFYVTCVRH